VTSPAIPVLPNVLRNAAAPNTLRGMTAVASQAPASATRLSVPAALMAGLGVALIIAMVGLGRA
jgi:hypothetical protein